MSNPAELVIGEVKYRVTHNINVPGDRLYTPEQLIKDEKLLLKLSEQGRKGIETHAAVKAVVTIKAKS